LTTETIKPIRAVASDVQCSFLGVITLPLDLVPVKRSDGAAKFELACTECDDPTKLSQQYVCPNNPDHGPFVSSTAGRAMKVDGILRLVSEDEMAAVKEPTLPKGEATFSVFHASSVESQTLPNGAVYRLRSKGAQKAGEAYAMLVDLLTDTTLAFICEMTNRGVQKMYRCISRDGSLMLTELIRPGEFYPSDLVSHEYDGRMLENATSILKANVEDFDPEIYRNVTRDRVTQLAEVKRDPNAPPIESVAKAKPAEEESDLFTALALAAENVKAPAKKAPAKKAPKKAAAKAS